VEFDELSLLNHKVSSPEQPLSSEDKVVHLHASDFADIYVTGISCGIGIVGMCTIIV
jgi:hypothetical protein